MTTNTLHYRQEDQWVEIPVWTKYFADLGAQAVAAAQADAKLIVGLAVPSRAYAAAFAALGVVTARAYQTEITQSPTTNFEQICNLPQNAPVSITVRGRNGAKRKKKGVFVGITEHYGSTCAMIMVNSKSAGGASHLIREVDASMVEILASGSITLPKRQTGKLVRGVSAFAKGLLRSKNARLSTKQSRLDCAIVGRINTLSREIADTSFAVPGAGDKYYEGKLQDVLRVRRFIGDGDHFASEVIRVNGRALAIPEHGGMPPFIVFDGATGFIRWHSHVRRSNWIVVIDRTDSRFREAADVLNEAHLNRIHEERHIELPTPAEGVEVLSFYERC